MKAWRAASNLTQKEAGSKIGVPFSTLQKYEMGVSEPNSHALEGLAKLGVNTNWLLTGEGPMLTADVAPKPYQGSLPPKPTLATNEQKPAPYNRQPSAEFLAQTGKTSDGLREMGVDIALLECAVMGVRKFLTEMGRPPNYQAEAKLTRFVYDAFGANPHECTVERVVEYLHILMRIPKEPAA